MLSMRSERAGPFQIAIAFLLLIDCIKHGLTFTTGPTAIVFDAREYWQQAGNVATGDWLLMPGSADCRTPLYPLFVGTLRWLFASDALIAVAVVQHGLQIVTGLLTALICWRVSGSRAIALVGYALSVLCLTRPWFANVLLTESMFTLLLTATVAAVAAYHHQPSMSRSALIGVLLGATILVRPVPQLLFLPLAGLFFLHATTATAFRQALQHCAAVVLVLMAALAPWCLRNWIVFEHPYIARVPAVNKWQVCFQDGSAARLPIPQDAAGQRLRKLLPEIDRGHAGHRHCYRVVAALKDKGLSDRQVDELISSVCESAVREHPSPFAWATFKRFVNFWRCEVQEYPFYSTYPNRTSRLHGQRTWRIESVATWYEAVLRRVPAGRLRWNELVACAAAAGTILLIARSSTRPFGCSLAVVFLYFASVTAVLELENYRYRMVLEPCLIVAVACGIGGSLAHLCRLRFDRRQGIEEPPPLDEIRGSQQCSY
jgi:hypothetical protein